MIRIQQTDITLLTPKEQSILFYLYRFTCLTSRHVQYLLNHKDHSRITIWLTSLIDHRYISKIKSNVSTYMLTPLARKEVRKFMNKKSIRYPIHLNNNTLNIYLNSASVYISLQNTYPAKEQNFIYFTPIDLLEKKIFQFLSPDGYFSYIRESSKRHFFLEIDSEGQTTRTIKKKISRYISYYNSNSWEKFSPNFFPAVCIISQTKERAGKIKVLCEKVIEENNNIPIIFLSSYLDQFSDSAIRSRWLAPFQKEEHYI